MHITLKLGHTAPLHRFVTETLRDRVLVPTEHFASHDPHVVHVPTWLKKV